MHVRDDGTDPRHLRPVPSFCVRRRLHHDGGIISTYFWPRGSLNYNAGGDQPPLQLPPSLEPFRRRPLSSASVQDLLHDHPSDKGLARVQRVEPVFNGAPLDAGRFQFLRLRPIMPVMPGGKNAPCKGSGLVSGPKLRLGLHGSGARRSSWTARPASHPHRQPRSEFMTQRCRGGKRAVR